MFKEQELDFDRISRVLEAFLSALDISNFRPGLQNEIVGKTIYQGFELHGFLWVGMIEDNVIHNQGSESLQSLNIRLPYDFFPSVLKRPDSQKVGNPVVFKKPISSHKWSNSSVNLIMQSKLAIFRKTALSLLGSPALYKEQLWFNGELTYLIKSMEKNDRVKICIHEGAPIYSL